VRSPRLFLFDEPLSNLDAKLRVQMRTELRELHQKLGVTSIYVTHDQIEAMTMADRIVVLRDGIVEQQGRPLEIYDRPANTFVAGFIGSPAKNHLDGGEVIPFAPLHLVSGTRLTLGVRPEHLRVQPPDGPDGLPAQLRVVEPTGSETLMVAQTRNGPVTILARERIAAQAGDAVRLLPDPDQVHWFDAAGQRIEAA
jgi:multiple sugar transport system ATP-binding protein